MNQVSRFITTTDPKAEHVVFDLPLSWWSRPYEYAFALTHCQPGEKVLDAACGLCHPLKFALLGEDREVFGCDFDERILRASEILDDVERDAGPEWRDVVAPLIGQVQLEIGDLTGLPYRDEFFDTVFCISVLEHLHRHTPRGAERIFRAIGRRVGVALAPSRKVDETSDFVRALAELARVLKPNGRLVLTFDVPDVEPQLLFHYLLLLKLKPVGEVEFQRPQNAIHSQAMRLYCFRAILEKAHS